MRRRDFLAAPALLTLPALAGAGPAGRVLDAGQWATIALVQDHLLPSEPGAPGAADCGATAWLDAVLADPQLAPARREQLLAGIGWLDDLARGQHGQPFVALDASVRENLLRIIADSRAGDEWLSLLINYTLEALLADPVYGVNPGGIGWAWLDHDPGQPRPTERTRYGVLNGNGSGNTVRK